MLVLARKVGEKLIIDQSIMITILNVSSTGDIRLGIEAPIHIPVDRLEVFEKKQFSHAQIKKAEAGKIGE